ncbi:hypothetical protein [Streptomyces griseomycini]|uniref:Uncharacterized protein n=1 Tax=Streptomyces griseomycini TaxID=66895 RepID=A0A7W7PRU0_9ACTN|nr:hypothetical protein [Streptomyces griseomycini]MBB4900169.1 hypothetical protein [Streptomyces griseomycini]GGR26420.1 hypothetical protein GCM10015536_35140 [Streptomyces griseomycini]
MSEHDTILRTTGTAALTLVAVACVAGLAEALRRGRGRARAEAARRHGHHGHGRHGSAPVPATPAPPAVPVIPRQRQTGPRAETVRLTPAERDAFAGLVRRFGESG